MSLPVPFFPIMVSGKWVREREVGRERDNESLGERGREWVDDGGNGERGKIDEESGREREKRRNIERRKEIGERKK
jgi:hypothetical protein